MTAAAAILVFRNNKTAAMLVFQTNPVGVDLFSYVTLSFVPINCIDAVHVSENALLGIGHLHDGVILLLQPESFSFFFSCLNSSQRDLNDKSIICTRKENRDEFWS